MISRAKIRIISETQKENGREILEIPAKFDMFENNRLYLIPKRASTTFTT